MFQNFAACRASLIGIVRSTQAKKRFRHGSRERYISPNFSKTSLLQTTTVYDISCRSFSSGRRPGFLSQFIENIRQEMQKNKEMKESLKKFREEAEKLEQSEALRSARQKFQTVESEASKGSEVIKEKIGSIKEKVQEVLEEASKSEIGKKAGQLGEEITKSAKGAAETISEKSQALGKTGAFQTISQTAEAVREELDTHGMQGRVYVPPKKLRKRKEISDIGSEKQVEANTEATGIELHKDSKFYQSWQNFKENNPYVNKVLDWKIKYEESDNPVVRASRLLTDKVTDIMGDLFQKTHLSQALTEICKVDPSFDKVKFLKDCETDFIPNILEAIARGDLEILKDWCHEGPYNVLSQPIISAQKLGYRIDHKILDIDNVDLISGSVVEDHGPVLVINFQCQQTLCVRDKKNKVVEGDPEKVIRVNYNWIISRDPTEINPKAAWRLADLTATSTVQLL